MKDAELLIFTSMMDQIDAAIRSWIAEKYKEGEDKIKVFMTSFMSEDPQELRNMCDDDLLRVGDMAALWLRGVIEKGLAEEDEE